MWIKEKFLKDIFNLEVFYPELHASAKFWPPYEWDEDSNLYYVYYFDINYFFYKSDIQKTNEFIEFYTNVYFICG